MANWRGDAGYGERAMMFGAVDGDAWFRRNRVALETAAKRDWPLKLIEKYGLVNRDGIVAEMGCANGWRLAWLNRHYGCFCIGIDVSAEAIDAAPQSPDMVFYQRPLHEAAIDASKVVICHFVLHWVARELLMVSLAAIDNAVASGGYLIIGDFLPDEPTKVPYHHREGLWTYKLDYSHILEATGNYRRVERIIFDHDIGVIALASGNYIDPMKRAAVTLLQKEDGYRIGARLRL